GHRSRFCTPGICLAEREEHDSLSQTRISTRRRCVKYRLTPKSQETQSLEAFMSNNLDQLTDWLKDHKITEVECMIADLTGITRGKISPANKFIAEKGMRLPESVLLQT